MRISHALTLLLAAALALAVALASAPSTLGPAGVAAAQDSRLPAGIAARVYGKDIRESDVLDRLARNYAKSQRGAELLSQMIDASIVEQEAARRGITVTASELDAYIANVDANIRQRSRNQDTIETIYEGSTRQEFRATAREFILREKMARVDLGRKPGEEISERLLKLWLYSMRKRLGVGVVELSPAADDVLKGAVIEALPGGVLARAGSQTINRHAFAKHLRNKLPQEMVQGVVMELVEAAAAEHRLRREGETVTPREVDAAIDRMRERFLEDPQVQDLGIKFEQFLVRSKGLTVEDLRNDPTFSSRIGMRRLLNRTVTDPEVRAHWEASRELYGERAMVRQVFVAAQDAGSGEFKLPTFKQAWKQALGAYVDVRTSAGLDSPGGERSRVPVAVAVTEVAKSMARNDTARRAAGEPAVWSRLTVEGESLLAKLAFEGTVGELSRPVRSKVGWHVVFVEARRPAPPFAEIAHRVREDVVAERLNKFGIDVRNDTANVILR